MSVGFIGLGELSFFLENDDLEYYYVSPMDETLGSLCCVCLSHDVADPIPSQ